MTSKFSPRNISHYDPQRMTVQTEVSSKPWIRPADYRKHAARQSVERRSKDVQGLLKIYRLQNSSPRRDRPEQQPLRQTHGALNL